MKLDTIISYDLRICVKENKPRPKYFKEITKIAGWGCPFLILLTFIIKYVALLLSQGQSKK